MNTSNKSTYKNRCKEDRSIFVRNTTDTENNYLLLVNFNRSQHIEQEVAAARKSKYTVLDVVRRFVGGDWDEAMPEDLPERFDTEGVNIWVDSAILVNYLISHYVRPAHCRVLPQYDLSVDKSTELPSNQS